MITVFIICLISVIFAVEFLQRQLKNLKDNLKKCLDKRQQMTKSGAAALSLPKCKYFDQMQFLHEKTANQPTVSNVTCQVQQAIPPPVADTCLPTNPTQSTSAATKRKASDTFPPSSSQHGFKARQDAIDMAILKQLESTDKTLSNSIEKERADDEVSLYCRSLIPIISSFTVRKKRLAMVKISQLLFDIEFEE